MGAKFIVDRRCPVKTSLTLTGLIEAIKHKGLLRRINELAASGTVSPPVEGTRVDMVLPPEAGVYGEMTVRDLQRQTELLLQHRITCRQCPSSLNGHVGGCIAYVPYPISEGMEVLLWTTAVRALEGDLPDSLLPAAAAFAARAQELRQTPFAEGVRVRGDLLSARPRVWQNGPLWKRERLTSAQVLEAFFLNGVLSGDELKAHAGFLQAALAVATATEQVVQDEAKRMALVEDVEPYCMVYDLMLAAIDQGLGVYVWP
ncbi:MAG TPA: hypothetical protein VD902_01925 [Symbiobacteriaceae bacterium]|nr:hypothetical protein [Symbiobacteriaceae bacterium]